MLQELDKASGEHPGAPYSAPSVCSSCPILEALCNSSLEAVAEQDLPHLHSRGFTARVQDLHPGASPGQAPDCHHQPGQGELDRARFVGAVNLVVLLLHPMHKALVPLCPPVQRDWCPQWVLPALPSSPGPPGLGLGFPLSPCTPSAGFGIPLALPAALHSQGWVWGSSYSPRTAPGLTWSCRSLPGAAGPVAPGLVGPGWVSALPN